MIQTGVVPALIGLANKTPDAHTCASATSLLRLLTHSRDRRSTDGIHGGGLNMAGNYDSDAVGTSRNQERGPRRDMYRQHGNHAFQGFFQI